MNLETKYMAVFNSASKYKVPAFYGYKSKSYSQEPVYMYLGRFSSDVRFRLILSDNMYMIGYPDKLIYASNMFYGCSDPLVKMLKPIADRVFAQIHKFNIGVICISGFMDTEQNCAKIVNVIDFPEQLCMYLLRDNLTEIEKMVHRAAAWRKTGSQTFWSRKEINFFLSRLKVPEISYLDVWKTIRLQDLPKNFEDAKAFIIDNTAQITEAKTFKSSGKGFYISDEEESFFYKMYINDYCSLNNSRNLCEEKNAFKKEHPELFYPPHKEKTPEISGNDD